MRVPPPNMLPPINPMEPTGLTPIPMPTGGITAPPGGVLPPSAVPMPLGLPAAPGTSPTGMIDKRLNGGMARFPITGRFSRFSRR